MTIAEKLDRLHAAKREYSDKTVLCFTADTDWASEYAIGETLSFFKRYDIPLTMFITHSSEVFAKAVAEGSIDGGLHPNFWPGSSQGGSVDEVLDYCFKLLPGAECYRAHRYYDVNDVADKMPGRGILYDSNLGTQLDDVFPFVHRSGIVRFPVFFEDGGYLWAKDTQDEVTLAPIENRLFSPGIKVINIHPMHFMLNTPWFSYTREIKDRLSREAWNELDAAGIAQIAHQGGGLRTLTEEMVARALEMQQKGTARIMSLGGVYREMLG